MATAQAAHDACHASEELKKAGESGSHAAKDSDDEDPAAPFVRTPFDDWCKAQVNTPTPGEHLEKKKSPRQKRDVDLTSAAWLVLESDPPGAGRS